MMRSQMMSVVWLINALENTLHEPNCLMNELLKEGTFKPMSSTDLTMDEKAFAIQEIKTFMERLSLSRKLLERLEAAAGQAEQKLKAAEVSDFGL